MTIFQYSDKPNFESPHAEVIGLTLFDYSGYSSKIVRGNWRDASNDHSSSMFFNVHILFFLSREVCLASACGTQCRDPIRDVVL
ncbi:unnamed protein product [Urochloa humidicola]